MMSNMDILERIRLDLDVMKKHKRSIRGIGELRIFVSEKIFLKLVALGQVHADRFGRYFFEGTRISLAHDYPDEYIAVE